MVRPPAPVVPALMNTTARLEKLKQDLTQAGQKRSRGRQSSSESDRGREADHPGEIPPKGWMDVLRRAWGAVSEQNLFLIAGGVTYALLLALFPALAALVSLYGLVFDASQIEKQVEALSGILPVQTQELLTQQLEYTLVNAIGGDLVKDADSYMAVLARPWILIVKAVFNVMLGVLAGYMTGKIAGSREMALAGIAGAAVTVTLALGLTTGQYAALPLWMRILLLVTTGPAMLAGAWIRMQARLALESVPEAPPASGTGANAGRETP